MDEPYREQILEHYKRPHNFGELEPHDISFEDSNSFCGDEQRVMIRLVESKRVAEVRWLLDRVVAVLDREIREPHRRNLFRDPAAHVEDAAGRLVGLATAGRLEGGVGAGLAHVLIGEAPVEDRAVEALRGVRVASV